MIIGLGTDLVSIERMRKKFSERLAKKILTRKELQLYDEVENKVAFLSKSWAVKEATYKALNCPFDLDMLKDIEYVSPAVYVNGVEGVKFFLSVSDDNGFAMATVVVAQIGDDAWNNAF